MTQAVAVRRDGDTFQARLFWLHAAKLLDPGSPIVRVGFESGPKCFDDVWVEYDVKRTRVDQNGFPLQREHMQCKWHVAPDSYGYSHLVDPDFINANARSLLQRALAAQRAHSPDGNGVRFKLVTNWRVDRDDPLREMIGLRSGAIRLDRLYQGATERSQSGAVRKAWREHLGINEDELRCLAGTLAFGEATDSLEGLRDVLDVLFDNVGLRRIPQNESAFSYDDAVFQWMSQGRLEFDRSTFRATCAKEGLLGQPKTRPRAYGVKSFQHPIDNIEDRCQKVLDLVPAFEERYIRDDRDWREQLYPALKEFLLSAAQEGHSLRLVLDAHSTLAFAAGSVLNVKSGRYIELEQRTNGQEIWAVDDRAPDPFWSTLVMETVEIDPSQNDVAVAIGLTHEIAADVQRYVEANLKSVSRLLIVRPSNGPSSQSVICGRHALQLADGTARAIVSERSDVNPGNAHLFIAAPNVFSFLLGQRQPGIGRVRLYEFDFGGGRNRTYTPALSLPPTSPIDE